MYTGTVISIYRKIQSMIAKMQILRTRKYNKYIISQKHIDLLQCAVAKVLKFIKNLSNTRGRLWNNKRNKTKFKGPI